MSRTIGLLLLSLVLPTSAVAAEDDEGASSDSDAPAASGPVDDGPRRRRGTLAGVGFETVADDFGNKLTATMGGLDTHWGMQINDMVGVYVPVHLSFGSFRDLGTVAGVPVGLTGTFAVTAVADVTFIDRVFVGGGAGLGILNNPMGPAIHLRAGGYPLMKRKDDSNRRVGLATALDLRLIYAKGVRATYPMLTIGYASF